MQEKTQKAAYRRHPFPKAQQTLCANHIQEQSQHPNASGSEGRQNRGKEGKKHLDQVLMQEPPSQRLLCMDFFLEHLNLRISTMHLGITWSSHVFRMWLVHDYLSIHSANNGMISHLTHIWHSAEPNKGAHKRQYLCYFQKTTHCLY